MANLFSMLHSLFSAFKSHVIIGTKKDDVLKGSYGNDTIIGLHGDDVISGGKGNDKLFGKGGDDVIYGGTKAKFCTTSVDFGDTCTYNRVSDDGTSMVFNGLTLKAIGGTIDYFDHPNVTGLGIISPSDDVSKIFPNEIDFYNDDPEHVILNFNYAQSNVTITLQQLYQERQFTGPVLAAEKADVKVVFTDGTSITQTFQAVQSTQPGELVINLSSSDFGGKMIASVDLFANDSLAPQRPDLPDEFKDSYNATHPFSEFILKDVEYAANCAKEDNGCDFLVGNWGNDMLFGGGGDDKLIGNAGNDYLVGGYGNDKMYGGAGCDTFAFGWEATPGSDIIYDFKKGTDKLALLDGVVVTDSQIVGGGTLITFSTGSDVLLQGVKVSNVDSLF